MYYLEYSNLVYYVIVAVLSVTGNKRKGCHVGGLTVQSRSAAR